MPEAMPEPIFDVADLNGETWLPIPGYENYAVSNYGRVKSLGRPNTEHRPRILRENVKHHGYRSVCLYRKGKQRRVMVHRLVLTAFVGECPAGHEGCHRNGDTGDNRLANLYWGTPQQNAQDAIDAGNHHHLNKTHCPSGHPYDDENTRVYRGKWRYCRKCGAERRKTA